MRIRGFFALIALALLSPLACVPQPDPVRLRALVGGDSAWLTRERLVTRRGPGVTEVQEIHWVLLFCTKTDDLDAACVEVEATGLRKARGRVPARRSEPPVGAVVPLPVEGPAEDDAPAVVRTVELGSVDAAIQAGPVLSSWVGSPVRIQAADGSSRIVVLEGIRGATLMVKAPDGSETIDASTLVAVSLFP